MTTSGVPGSGRVACTTLESRSITTSVLASAAHQSEAPRSSGTIASPCGPAAGTGIAPDIVRTSASMTIDRRVRDVHLDRDHRDRAVGPRGLAKVEAEESPEPSVVRERIRPRANRDPVDERLVRTAEEAHPSGFAIGREEQ